MFTVRRTPRYDIRSIDGRRPPYNMFLDSSSDALLYIFHIVSYFYERFKFVEFKLFNKQHYWPNEFRGRCYVGLNRLPLIKQVHHTIGDKYPTIPSECHEEAITRAYRINNTQHSVTFPKSRLRNVVPHYRAPLAVYIKNTGYPEVLNFEWSTPEDQGYDLRLTIGEELLFIPKVWWIHQQSDSLLGNHKNIFAPDHFQTTRTIYSYSRGNRYYYADGKYVKKPGINYLRHKVTEYQPTIYSWQLPNPEWKCNLQ